MSVLTLNVEFREKGIKKTMQFISQIVVYDACRLIRDKLGLLNDNPNNYGLFRVEADSTKCVWMESGRTLEYYLIRNGDTLEYKNKIRQLRVRTLDGGAIKTIFVDESQPISQLMIVVCSKMGISNHEEYSLVRDNEFIFDGESSILNNNNNQTNGKDKRFENTFMNTIGRKKERQIQQLRAKLHTDEEIQWVDQSKTLREQNISEGETLILRRKFFFSDTNVDTRDPVQLNLLYLQCRDGVLNGLHPVSRDTAIKLAALQCYIEYGSFQEGFQRSIDAKDLLPKEYVKAKEHEKNIVQEYRELIYEDQAAPKKRYCELCQSLPTYGVTFFLVKEKLPGKNKLIPRLLGINKESVMRVDEKTKAVLKEWPLEQVRRWAASYKTFTLDFGDYKDGYYSVQTLDGEKICQLIGGYIDIIMKKKKVIDHLGIEGDEGSTMLEDIVAPACATLIAHGELGQGYAQDGHVALPGVLRSGAGTPLGQGVQYGAVGGRIIAQELPKGERIRYLDSQEKSQRALIGTIEATIRAVEEAEEEIFKQTHVELPKFDDTSHNWRVEIEKEAVEDRIAAMGAATAEVVQLTAIPEESDNRVGTAIATIGSNLPEMGRGVRELASLLPDENQAEDLINAARKLCGAFGNFLDKVNPEKNEKRINILSAATRVGEFSYKVINTMNKSNAEEDTLYDQLNQKARNIATSANKLVLQAKAVSVDCNESSLKEQIIYSAMKTAFVTSELIACTRIVGPTIDHTTSQDHLTEAAHNVARSVEQLLVDANGASKHSASGNGEQQYSDLHAAARQVSNALDDLIYHVRLSNRNQLYNRKTQQDYSYEQLVQSSNRVITHQGTPHELVRDSESVIRHSCLLVDEFENEAKYGSSDQRDKLLNAARSVAQATSNMIDATKKCQSCPQEAEAQIALKNAAENLVQVTNEATCERINYQTIQHLEGIVKDTSAVATQTIAAANAAKPYLQSKLITETLMIECMETSRYISTIIQHIKESQNSYLNKKDNFTYVNTRNWKQFRAQSGLIYETSKFSASKLIEAARSAVPYVNEQHTSTRLLTTTQDLSTQLAKLRVVLNNAQQLNFELQLDYSEDLICELDNELIEIGFLAKNNKLSIPEDFTSENASIKLDNISRLISSSIAQLISSVRTNDRKYIGSAALEATQSLRAFVHTVHGVVSTRSDVSLDSFILNSRSVVHDFGIVFDCVCKNSLNSQLEDAVKIVSSSIKKMLACLPDNAVIEEAIERIRAINNESCFNSVNPVNVEDLRQIAAKLIESSSKLVVSARELQYSESVQVFVNSYEYFHLCVLHIIKILITEMQHRHLALESLDIAKSQALNVLNRARAANVDPNNLAHTQALSQASRSLTDTINIIIEQHYNRKELHNSTLWSRECENALRKIQSVRYIFDNQSTLVPLNLNSYYDSLSQVTNEARRLGDGMTGMAHFSRCKDTTQVCQAVHTVASSICGLVENAAQCAYLVGVGDKQSEPGKPAIFDFAKYEASLQNIKQFVENIKRCDCNKLQIIEDSTNIKTHTSNLAKICQNASDQSKNVNTKRQFLTYACDITLATDVLMNCLKKLDSNDTENNYHECSKSAYQILAVAENLEAFVNNPDFGPVLAKISVAGCEAQQPILRSACQILNASSEIISTAKNLDTHSLDESTWERIADSSRVVSDSIIQLVAAIFEQAPGQNDLELGLSLLRDFIQQIENAALTSLSQEKIIYSFNITEEVARQQILHALQSLLDLIDELKIAAISHAEAIGHSVQNHIKIIENLVNLSIQAASLSQYNSRIQINILEHCKTIIEAEIYMFITAKNSAGNPRAQEMHSIVEKASEQLSVAIIEFQRNIIIIDSESGVIHGIIETISRSISLADKFCQTPSGDTFADMQTRIINTLNEIKQIETNMSFTEPKDLGLFSLQLAEHYKNLVNDTRIAQNLLASSDLALKLKLTVQKLGTACIEVVKTAGQRRQHFNDERIHNQFSNNLNIISMYINEVMAALYDESRGTQACINAAKTVTGIIGDLDTTIMFATSGSLNPCIIKNEINFETYKNNIIKAAKALIEDTKALVCGAASNQEQLAVAAQNTVRTIVHLVEAVKGGAATISGDSAESQVMAIHAVRDVAAALSNLIQTTKNASGKAPTDPAIGNLKEAAKVMVTNVSSLLRLIKTIEDTSQRSVHAIEAAVNAIDVCLRQYDNSESAGRYAVTADEVIHSTLSIIEAATRATSAHTSSNSAQEYQELIIAAANYARQAVNNLLTTTRAAAWSVENAEIKYKILNNGREVALQVKNMLSLLLITYRKPDDRLAKNNLFVAANEISKAVNNLTQCSEQLRTDSVSTEWLSEVNSAEPIAIAENELIGAANSIEEASTKLAKLRLCQIHKSDKNFTFNEQIIVAASSTAVAVQTLVKAASVAQRELVFQGRIESYPIFAADNYQWSEGLISASRLVAAAVCQLCEAANDLVQGHASEEKLISAAKQVASSTAHLLVACKVKSDIDSHAMQRLQIAGHAVKTATEHLVNTARQSIVDDKRALIISDRMVTGIAQVMDAQEEVIRKERELEEARVRLAAINKSRYEKSPELI